MDILNSVVSAAVIMAVGGLLSIQMRGRFRDMERRLDRLEAGLDKVRSDILNVALAVGARPSAGAGPRA